ncbi:MAG: ribokinase [Alteromonas naphthalenivorans]|jgi:ribokinase
MNEPLKVLTIGGATQDIIIEYQPKTNCVTVTNEQQTHMLACKEGSKIEVQNLRYATGGGATNAAVSFKRLEFKTSTLFNIGSDQAGEFIKKKMEEEAIKPYCQTIKLAQTGTAFIIPTPHKDRIVFVHRGANATLTKDHVPDDLIAEQNFIYITSLSGQAARALPYITRKAKQLITTKGIRVAVNPGTSQLTSDVSTLKAALPDIDVLILNAEEMKLLMVSLKPRFFKSTTTSLISEQTGSLLKESITHSTLLFTLIDYFKEILSYGVKRVVVTNGKEGVYVATADTIYFHPALTGPIANTVGAGDAFGSSFTAMLALGLRIEDAIRVGVLQAQSVISHQDAKTGLLSIQSLEKKLQGLDTALLKKFNF